jgi:hypothetical protein
MNPTMPEGKPTHDWAVILLVPLTTYKGDSPLNLLLVQRVLLPPLRNTNLMSTQNPSLITVAVQRLQI